jgi:hypothetical protein
MNGRCVERDKLMDRVQATLASLADLANEEKVAMRSGNHDRADAVDKLIETTIGDKERAIGAYRQHLNDHGCGGPEEASKN